MHHYEAEVLRGLAPFAVKELAALPGVRILSELEGEETAIRFAYAGALEALESLRTVVAVYGLESFDVPRPKALLGHQHWQRVQQALARLQTHHSFQGFRLSAAGKDSAVLTRLRAAIAETSGLADAPETGELLLRLRAAGQAWELLLRLTPRPLSARAWRVCNLAGGLNATLASVMTHLAQLRPHDSLLDPMCGSGTLLIEARAAGFTGLAHGYDLNSEALRCSRANLAAAGYQDVALQQHDATDPHGFAERYSCILVNVPWGDAVGDHASNLPLYQAFLQAMAQISTPNARMVLLTHDIAHFRRVLAQQQAWTQQEVLSKLYHGGHHPSLYLLRRA